MSDPLIPDGVQRVAGSNPVVPTSKNKAPGTMHQVLFYCLMDARGSSRTKRDRPDQHLKKHLAGPAKCFFFGLRLLDLEDETPHLFG